MALSIFLAKAFGLYFLVIGLGLAFNRDWYQKTMLAIFKDSTDTFVISLLALILGVLLVISHPYFTPDWQSIITVLAWIALIKGVIPFLFPEHVMQMRQKVLSHKRTLVFAAAFCLILGVYLSYIGFIVYL